MMSKYGAILSMAEPRPGAKQCQQASKPGTSCEHQLNRHLNSAVSKGYKLCIST